MLNAIMRVFIAVSIFLSSLAPGQNSPYVLNRYDNVEIPVLMYHHIDDKYENSPGVIIPRDTFEEHLIALKDEGYTSISFEELYLYQKGKFKMPKNPIIITFDDGYTSNYQLAYPLLKEYGFKANINIVVSSRGITPGFIPHFSWDEAKEMVESGLVEIGSHSYDMHSIGVRKLSEEDEEHYKDRITEDFIKSRKHIVENLGTRPIVYCYPFGIFTDISQQVAEDAGFVYQLTMRKGVINNTTLKNTIPRITVFGHYTGEQLIEAIEAAKEIGK